METRICVVCSVEFLAWASREKQVCSDRCEYALKYATKKVLKIRTLKICANCGNEFMPLRKGQKYCSSNCKIQSRRIDSKAPVNCAYCGVLFVPKQPDQKCCCEDHGKKYYRKRYERPKNFTYICKNCGMQYTTHRKECDQFCSRKCSDDFRLHRKEQKLIAKREIKQKAYVCCLFCGTYFAHRHGSNYCSEVCRNKHNLQLMSDARIAHHVKKEYICKECGNKFIPTFGNKHRSFCSYKCCCKRHDRISKSARRAKLRNVNRERIDPIAVFERDGWTCQLCGVETPMSCRGSVNDNAPELDHIVPLALLGDHVFSNVQCLCRKCNQGKGATPPYPVQKDSKAKTLSGHGGQREKNSGSGESR